MRLSYEVCFVDDYASAIDDVTADFDLLIERVQELENENRILRTVAESNKYIGEQYLEQNKRYREALEEVLKTGDYEDPQDYIDRIVTKACQALEGDLE